MPEETATAQDAMYMREALRVAEEAVREREVPCAAVLVGPDGEVIARAHALDRQRGNRISHAELLLLLENRLAGTDRGSLTLYTTLEPCIMCTAAILTEGIGRIVYGLPAPLDGGIHLVQDPDTVALCGGRVPRVTGGVLADECAALFRQFAELPDVPPGMADFARELLGML